MMRDGFSRWDTKGYPGNIHRSGDLSRVGYDERRGSVLFSKIDRILPSMLHAGTLAKFLSFFFLFFLPCNRSVPRG